jgi:DNA-binding LacI/PurR family transcriptional regulator
MPQQDVKIISCNNELPFLNALYPRPATIDIRMRAIGRMAVNHLVYLANQESDHTREARRTLAIPQLILPD